MVTGRVTSSFDILPAIDLRGGRVVRLVQGDFDRETPFSDDPFGVATAFVQAGARWLHVVDLDGARAGSPVHGQAIRAIVTAIGDRAQVEVAGGLRTEASVAAMIEIGAARVVVGTAALRDPALVARSIERFGPGRVAVALDVRDGLAVGDGWRAGAAGIPVVEALERLTDVGVATFEVTAIERDGLLQGPDLELYQRIATTSRAIIASAGVSSVDDVRATRDVGCAGVIIGRALYDGRLSIPDALAAVEPPED